MVHDRAADRSWSWRRADGNLLLSLGAADQPAFVSIKPPFIEWPGGDGSSFWDVLLLAIMGVAAIGAVVGVIRFILHKVFVVDVIEPLWPGTSEPVRDLQPHLFIVSAEGAGDPRPLAMYCDVDLAQAPSDDPAESKWFDKQIHRLARSAGSRDLLLLHFEERLHDRVFNERKVALAERAMHMANRRVVIVSTVPPRVICAASRPEGDQTAVEWNRRWTALLSHFTIVPAAPAAAAPAPALSATTVLTDWTTAG